MTEIIYSMDYSDEGIWEREKGICPGCHREITNKAFFSGAHVKGTCQRDKRIEAIPKPTVFPHPSKATLARKVTDGEVGYHAYNDWTRLPNGELRLPTTLPELCQWWHLKPVGA